MNSVSHQSVMEETSFSLISNHIKDTSSCNSKENVKYYQTSLISKVYASMDKPSPRHPKLQIPSPKSDNSFIFLLMINKEISFIEP